MGMLEEILLMYMQTPVEEMLNAMLEVVVGVQGVQDSLVWWGQDKQQEAKEATVLSFLWQDLQWYMLQGEVEVEIHKELVGLLVAPMSMESG